MKMKVFSIAVIVAWTCLNAVKCFPQGGNSVISHCKDLRPAHIGAPQTSSAPYVISTDIDTVAGYTPEESYTVTLQATNASVYPTHGFIIQFRNSDNFTTRGVFTAWNSSIAAQGDCDRLQDTIVQFNPNRVDLPEVINFTWQAPSSGAGPLRIWSSYVVSYPVYWIHGFVSQEIAEGGGAAITTDETPASVVVDLSMCGETKGCFRYPPTCSSQSTCQYIYTQQTGTAMSGEEYVEIELSSTDPGWVSVGYSVDRIMGGSDNPPDDVLACQYSGASVEVKNGYIIVIPGSRFHLNDNATVVGAGLTVLGASYSNGVLACRFRRNLYTGSPFDKDLRESYYQFYVWDPTPGGLVAPLNYHAFNAPIISSRILSVNANDTDLHIAGCQPWTEWSACSVSCGGGTRQRQMPCTASNSTYDQEACATAECSGATRFAMTMGSNALALVLALLYLFIQ
ncbi:putative ferric-chelate reductase 1 [Sycon ciliatum]|uniref:putative ferric-chelate reductase 1 n=1 Tax=Sycon ciliatum TaxID=27933 RepID=UPI0031F638B0